MSKSSKFFSLFAASAPALFVCWLVFVGTFARWEMLIGIGVALIAAAAVCIVQHADNAHFRVTLRDVSQLLYVPWLLLQRSCEILSVALRDLFGGRKAVSAFRLLSFETGKINDPLSTGRRTLAVAYSTMAPNFIVLGINVRDGYLLFHQIQRGDIPKLLKNLGARA